MNKESIPEYLFKKLCYFLLFLNIFRVIFIILNLAV